MALTLGISIIQNPAKAGSVAIDTTIVAAGTAPYTYQWYRQQGTTITPGAGNLVASQTGPGFASRNEPAGLQTYACKVTDAAAATSTVTITINVQDSNNDTRVLSRFNALPNANQFPPAD